jgi:hypothetical protein
MEKRLAKVIFKYEDEKKYIGFNMLYGKEIVVTQSGTVGYWTNGRFKFKKEWLEFIDKEDEIRTGRILRSANERLIGETYEFKKDVKESKKLGRDIWRIKSNDEYNRHALLEIAIEFVNQEEIVVKTEEFKYKEDTDMFIETKQEVKDVLNKIGAFGRCYDASITTHGANQIMTVLMRFDEFKLYFSVDKNIDQVDYGVYHTLDERYLIKGEWKIGDENDEFYQFETIMEYFSAKGINI